MDDITIIVVRIRNMSCFNTYDYPDPEQSYDNEEEQTIDEHTKNERDDKTFDKIRYD